MENCDLGKNKLINALIGHVRELSEVIGHRNVQNYDKLDKAAQYISKEMQSYGYHVELQKYYVPDISVNSLYAKSQKFKEVYNVIAKKLGQKLPEEVIVVGAHYDSCDSPGADDNASGIAGMLEIARCLADTRTQRTIQFIAFTNEEPPFFHTDFMGSRVYAKEARNLKIDIKLAIILDMIGYFSDMSLSQQIPRLLQNAYPDKGNFILAIGDALATPLLGDLARKYNKISKVPMMTNNGLESIMQEVEGFDFSDHWSFWQEGYPAVLLTDTAFLRNPHYHKTTDTYRTLNYEKMSKVVDGLGQVIYEWC